MNRPSSILSKVGLGRILYLTWHRPRAWIKRIRAAGGLKAHLALGHARAEMEKAAGQLAPVPPATGDPLELHLLTGSRFWYQTIFCLLSFARQAGRPITPVIYDDGSLTECFRKPIIRLFPAAHFISETETIARLDALLPADRYPALRERWLNYPHIRKIINPHIGSRGWKLVVDSDLLFFRRPDKVIDWLDRPGSPLHAVDCVESYGYPRPLMEELAGHPLAPLVNVGLTGIASEEIDWARMESWTRILIERHGTSYFLEQALIAMLVAGRRCTILPAGDYVTKPGLPEALRCEAVMHHYVDDSKRWYFHENWRHFARTDQP